MKKLSGLTTLALLLLSLTIVLPVIAAEKMPYGLKEGMPYKGTKLTFLVHNAAQSQAQAKRVGEFTELTGIEVDFLMVPYPSLREKITADAVAGTGDIDLYCFLDGWGPSMTGFLTPLNDYLEADGIDLGERLPPAYIKGGTYEGVTYGIPTRGHPQLLLYRTDLFEQAGVTPPKTWKELIAASQAIKEKTGKEGIATSIGHSPISGLIDPVAGSRNSIGEALTNLVWAPLKEGLKAVSLSANWMWPCKNEGEDARLYKAVEAVSDFACALGINVPTGKDSLSMKQKYKDKEVIAPGTVVISAAGNCTDITKVVEPVLQLDGGSIYYINLSKDAFKLGGSSFGQILNSIGTEAPTINDAAYFKLAFNTIQKLIVDGHIMAGHDIGSGKDNYSFPDMQAEYIL